MADRIASIETFVLEGKGAQGAYGAPYGFVVKVTSEDGLTGYGESDTMPEVAAAVVDAPYLNGMMSGLRAVLLGIDSSDPATVWQIMREATSNWGRDGVTRHAMAAIDIALWDIAGMRAGVPVHALLGTARRDRIEAYASHPLGTTLDETAAFAAELVSRGYRAVKFGWHPLGRDEAGDVAIVRTLREAIGDGVGLMIDGGMAWDAETAFSRARLFEPFDIRWLEEPLAAYDLAGYRELGCADVPIAAGEMAATYEELALLMATGGIDVLQVDISRVGLTEAMRVAQLAEELDIPLVNHTYSYVLNAAASLHFLAVVHRTSLFECQVTKNEIRAALDRDQLPLVDGCVAVPQGPGLGVAVDDEVLGRFRANSE
ncbi:MAG: mandelate racemase/muconate lactonizing enzyme family protein [Aestuariivirgaceae bacterium]